jgi:hypothetical protein
MKKFSLILFLTLVSWTLQAQYDTLTIEQIQFVPQAQLADCNDTTSYLGDTVYVRGTVVMDGGLAQAAGGRNVWIQDGTGPWSGIDVFTTGVPTPVPGTDVLNLAKGDSVLIWGIVAKFRGETEIIPLNIQLLNIERKVEYTPVSIGDLSDPGGINQLETGEQWEGVYIEITNVTVVDVDEFTAGGVQRVSFDVADVDGNRLTISDRFLAQRTPPNGNFVAPVIGTQYDTIRGVLLHGFPNGCMPTNSGTLLGYDLDPFDEKDYVIGASAPLISSKNRNPITPTSSQDVTISATIIDPDGVVTAATLFYAVGEQNNSYQQLPMNSTGSTYLATIPSALYSDGDIIKYYISATDDSALTSTSPVSNATRPDFFVVRDNGTTIYDVQYTIYSNGESGYEGLEVTVEGIVTATSQSNDLGFVYIQQEGATEWGGISLAGNTKLNELERGDKVSVTGIVQDATNFGLTRIGQITEVTEISSGNPLPDPIELDPANFTTYDFNLTEPYECMLVKLKDPSGGDMYIVETNSDAPSNFAEYRIGADEFDPSTGSRILAGRVTTSAFSSLSVSYINDSTWISNSGIINVPVCVITAGDTMTSVTGIMYYSFGNMKLLPRNNDDYENYRGANCPEGVNTTSIEDELSRSEIKAYPNPTRDQLFVEYNFARNISGQVRLHDMMGRVIAEKAVRGKEGLIDLNTETAAPGTYFLTVEAEGTVIDHKKIVILN